MGALIHGYAATTRRFCGDCLARCLSHPSLLVASRPRPSLASFLSRLSCRWFVATLVHGYMHKTGGGVYASRLSSCLQTVQDRVAMANRSRIQSKGRELRQGGLLSWSCSELFQNTAKTVRSTCHHRLPSQEAWLPCPLSDRIVVLVGMQPVTDIIIRPRRAHGWRVVGRADDRPTSVAGKERWHWEAFPRDALRDGDRMSVGMISLGRPWFPTAPLDDSASPPLGTLLPEIAGSNPASVNLFVFDSSSALFTTLSTTSDIFLLSDSERASHPKPIPEVNVASTHGSQITMNTSPELCTM
ncbi:hypothetical protein BO71DRAFT_435833 [Aspergillus ellipticus CBS 707.79]|uniref:Uncharacterized protein n=1 Tax=Aspergillus ellipticus CBS 707.79 TaxID=1448320 RepID=A0A319D1E8_9EURO|nr:hypothetical protein BO71DRAFT_435833 [Aspergillus ellipticus CBS 707.79]